MPCSDTCGFNKLPCPNCGSYAILQERNIGGKIEHVWTIIDSANPREVDKIKAGTRNSLGWPFFTETTDLQDQKISWQLSENNNNYENIHLNLQDSEESNHPNRQQPHSATAPPLSRSVSPDSGLYDLSRGRPELFRQSIASQITNGSNKSKQSKNMSGDSDRETPSSRDSESVESAQEATEISLAISSDDNQSKKSEESGRQVTSASVRYYMKKNFEDSTNGSGKSHTSICKLCNKGIPNKNQIQEISQNPSDSCQCDASNLSSTEDSFDPTNPFSENHQSDTRENTNEAMKSPPQTRRSTNPFDEDEINIEDEASDNQSSNSEYSGKNSVKTSSTIPCSTVLSAKKLMRLNKVGVMVENSSELKTLCFAPSTENRSGRNSNILAASAAPNDPENAYQTSKRTILLTQIAVGLGLLVLVGALIMFFGSVAKALMN